MPVSKSVRWGFESLAGCQNKMTAKIIPFEDKEPICSFCKKPKSKVKNLVKGKGSAHICDKCLEKCTNLIKEEK